MIALNFAYCRPESVEEAVSLYGRFVRPLYYGGGSEIISMCTAGSIAPSAVIDLKRLDALRVMQEGGGTVTLGAARTLEEIRTGGLFPLLGKTAGRIADHTNQCRITLGGNLCGTIMYREAALPLLLADATLELFGPTGRRTASIHAVFDGRMRLLPGEFVVSARIEKRVTEMPYAHIKRTFNEKIGYPAVTAVALKMEGCIRIAFSGICSHPFRSPQIEQAVNDRSIEPKARAEAAASLLPEPPHSDCEGSGAYRRHLLQMVAQEIIELFEGMP